MLRFASGLTFLTCTTIRTKYAIVKTCRHDVQKLRRDASLLRRGEIGRGQEVDETRQAGRHHVEKLASDASSGLGGRVESVKRRTGSTHL